MHALEQVDKLVELLLREVDLLFEPGHLVDGLPGFVS
jgi:hypothetical protein